ncbi:hypothetical protein [Paractinoplanes atraurantiacus]|uniref:hypothetical protein n=1 Tax=Paractinoplanes atraurantiacus TaxID=1036182 RepID=UPI000BE36982|nr:hypothetical protein [Actinoplanes atraurantiacus]
MADGLGKWRDAALGAVFQAQDATVRVFVDVREAGTGAAGKAAGRFTAGLDGLAGRGAAEREQAAAGMLGRAARAKAAFDAAVMAVATSELADRVVDAQLERVLRPLVRTILDDVLALLAEEPERIQPLVRGQRDTMVDELVGRIRNGAAAGDTAVDRVTTRVLRRGGDPVPVPPADPR